MAALSWGCKVTAEMVTYSRTQNAVLAKQSLKSVHRKQLLNTLNKMGSIAPIPSFSTAGSRTWGESTTLSDSVKDVFTRGFKVGVFSIWLPTGTGVHVL